MTYLRLSRDGYVRLARQVQELEEAADRGIANPDAAEACIGDIRTGLFRLRQIIDTGDAITAFSTGRDPLGPGAA
ncbi:MAG: hypothetical protein LBS37_04235 [Treponema sp.]|jgi:hypothetical protein|nr:hypothetical protein [Treponema sp.]